MQKTEEVNQKGVVVFFFFLNKSSASVHTHELIFSQLPSKNMWQGKRNPGEIRLCCPTWL